MSDELVYRTVNLSSVILLVLELMTDVVEKVTVQEVTE